MANYVQWHINDYLSQTMHLEPLEDLAYRRLLDLYYMRESALPNDIDWVARQIRLRSNKVEIESVLNEFFELVDDQWHQKRCDEELVEIKASKSAAHEKREHENERLARHRARRSAMFQALRDVGITPPYDIKIDELQRLVDTHCKPKPETTETDLKRVHNTYCNAPATANPIPNTHNKTRGRVREEKTCGYVDKLSTTPEAQALLSPIFDKNSKPKGEPTEKPTGNTPNRAVVEVLDPKTMGRVTELAKRLKTAGNNLGWSVSPLNSRLIQIVEKEVPEQIVQEGTLKALDQKKDCDYALATILGMFADANKAGATILPVNPKDKSGIQRRAIALGAIARPGETNEHFATRLNNMQQTKDTIERSVTQ